MQDVGKGTSFIGQKWAKDYKNSLDLDLWGQFEEARESYEKLARNMTVELSSAQSLRWADRDVGNIEKLAIALRLRCNVLKRGDDDGITLENMKVLVACFDNLFSDDSTRKKKFPLDFDSVPAEDLKKATVPISRPLKHANEENYEFDERPDSAPPLQPRITVTSAPQTPATISSGKKAGTTVSILINKIGFKEETHFVDPRITLSVVSGGRILEGAQDVKITASGTTGASPFRFEDKHMVFGTTAVLKQTQEGILPGAAIFFEFKHYKVEKHKWSTKCWAFLEREEIKAGPHVLELYKKPTDLKRKKLSLLTVKPLYLHIDVDLVKA